MSSKRLLALASLLALFAAGVASARYPHWVTVYYSNASKTVEVGREVFGCNNQYYSDGTRTAYALTTQIYCDVPAGGY